MNKNYFNKLSRRNFMKSSAILVGAAAFNQKKIQSQETQSWPVGVPLGRNCTSGKINLRSRPSVDSEILKEVFEDTVIEWEREVIGQAPPGLVSRRWVQTPGGYLYSPSVQPVENNPNIPLDSLPNNPSGPGMWVEVTVPYIDLVMDNPPARSPWLSSVQFPRLYFSQVTWVDQIRKDANGKVFYRLNEKYGNPGDILWASADAFRFITPDEILPIHPEVSDKRVIVDSNYQTLSCFEGNSEVYFCRVSTGAEFNAAGEAVENWSTPPGPHPIFRKLVSIHMSGDASGAGWDTGGIGWACFFAQGGVAIHSTFWHNNFGVPVSHGCVNARAEDAKWVFRWTSPEVPYDPGDITVGMPGGTIVEVKRI
jgi:hypothetical protein